MDDLDTETGDLIKKTFTEISGAYGAVTRKCKEAVMTYVKAAQEISNLISDERSISAEKVVAIHDRALREPTLSGAIKEFNYFPYLLANKPLATSVLWYSSAVTLVDMIRAELSLLKRCVSDLVDVEAPSPVWKPKAIEEHHSEFGALCFLAGEWNKCTFRVLRHWGEVKNGTFQHLPYKRLPQEFNYMRMPSAPDVVLVTQLSQIVNQFCRFRSALDWQPEIEPMKKFLNLDQQFKKSMGWPCTDTRLSGLPRTAVDGRSTYGPYEAPGWAPSPEFLALMEKTWEELDEVKRNVSSCSCSVYMAEVFMTRISETCAPDRPSCVSDLYRFVDEKPWALMGLAEEFANRMKRRTSLVINLLRLTGAAVVTKELDKSWSIFERKLGRSICAIEDIRSNRSGSRHEQANEAGRHITEILEHDWRTTIEKWEKIEKGAVLYVPKSPQQGHEWDFRFKRVVNNNHNLLMELYAAADRFLKFDKVLDKGPKIRLFRELLELDLRFQRSIGWEELNS